MTAKNGAEAVANADVFDAYAVGYCLAWVRGEAWEIGSLYGSAIDAWDGATRKHPGDRNPPEGAPCFYRGGNYGHIVVGRGRQSRRMRSTDCTYAGHVDNADLSWPETAWGDDYLGWTEDLNGVLLPLGTDDKPEDEMPDYGKARHTHAVKLTDGNWYAIEWGQVDSGDDYFDTGEPGIRAGGSRYQASLAVHIVDRGSASVQTSWVEMEDSEAVETSPIANHGGVGYAVDSRVGRVPEGRKLRGRVRVVGGDATLESAQFDALFFRS